MASIYTDSVDIENFCVNAYNYRIDWDHSECTIWYEPDDNDVMVPVRVTHVTDEPVDGAVINIEVVSNGFVFRHKHPQQKKEISKVVPSQADLCNALKEVTTVKKTVSAPWNPDLWEGCEEDLRQVQLKLNVANKQETNQ